MESLAGADSLVYLPLAVLDVLGLPYTGRPDGSPLPDHPQVLAKQRLRQAGLPTPDWVESSRTTHAPREGTQAVTTEPLTRLRSRASWIIKGVWDQASRGMDDDAVLRDVDLTEAAPSGCGSGPQSRAGPASPSSSSRAGSSTSPCWPVPRAPRCFPRPRSTFRPSRPASRASWAIAPSGRPIRSSSTTRPAASISTAADGPLLDELRRLADELLDALRASRLGTGRLPGRRGRAAVDFGDQRRSLPFARRRLCRGAGAGFDPLRGSDPANFGGHDLVEAGSCRFGMTWVARRHVGHPI